MKKTTAILSVILIFVLCLTLAACGEKASDSKDKATEAVTEKATEKPTDPPTEAPTDPPTEPPTEEPTEAGIVWDEDADGYIVSGKVVKIEDFSDDISFLSDFQAQYLPDVEQWAVLTISIPEGLTASELSPFLKCITVDDCEKMLDTQETIYDADYSNSRITKYCILYNAPYGYDYSMDNVHIDLK